MRLAFSIFNGVSVQSITIKKSITAEEAITLQTITIACLQCSSGSFTLHRPAVDLRDIPVQSYIVMAYIVMARRRSSRYTCTVLHSFGLYSYGSPSIFAIYLYSHRQHTYIGTAYIGMARRRYAVCLHGDGGYIPIAMAYRVMARS